MKPKTKKLIRILFIGTGFLLADMLINFIPTWNLDCLLYTSYQSSPNNGAAKPYFFVCMVFWSS